MTMLMQSTAFQTNFTVLRSCNFNKWENQLFSETHKLGRCVQLVMFFLHGICQSNNHVFG